MEYFEIVGINNPYYQNVVCHYPYGIVYFVYINPKINSYRPNDKIEGQDIFQWMINLCPSLVTWAYKVNLVLISYGN